MPAKVSLREPTPEERPAVDALARSRTAEARIVERAKIILETAAGLGPSAVARTLGVSRPTVYTWIRRFNAQGPYGLQDMPRSGRPATYPPEQVAEVIAAALTDPKELGLPYGCWTLDRLHAYLKEYKGIGMGRSRIDEILLAEGLRWRHQESWFGERVDPDFAAKRGRSRSSTPSRPRARSSSASTRWAPRRPRPPRARISSAPRPGSTPMAPHGPPDGQSRRSRPANGRAAATSSAPSGRRPGRRSPATTARGTGPTGSTSWSTSRGGCRRT